MRHLSSSSQRKGGLMNTVTTVTPYSLTHNEELDVTTHDDTPLSAASSVAFIWDRGADTSVRNVQWEF